MSFLDHKFGGVWEDRNRNDLLIETSRHSLTMSSLVVNEPVLRHDAVAGYAAAYPRLLTATFTTA